MTTREMIDGLLAFTDYTHLFNATVPYAQEQLDRQFTPAVVQGVRRIVLTGCGDSLFEAYAVRLAFEKWTGIPTEAVEALEYARYQGEFLPPESTAVFCISNAGGSSRTVESVGFANAYGQIPVAVTGNNRSPLVEQARYVVHRPVPQLEGVPLQSVRVMRNLAEYQTSLLTLYQIALHFGVQLGRLSRAEADILMASLVASAQDAAATGAHTAGQVTAYIDETLELNQDAFFFLGAGPAYATALFGAAKLHECVPTNGIAQSLEEWAHLQYFLTLQEGKKSHIIVIAPPGASLDRAQEIAASAVDLGAVCTVLGSPADRSLFPGARFWEVQGNLREEFSPLLYGVPLQMFGVWMALARGAASVPLSRGDSYKLIRGSHIRIPGKP